MIRRLLQGRGLGTRDPFGLELLGACAMARSRSRNMPTIPGRMARRFMAGYDEVS